MEDYDVIGEAIRHQRTIAERKKPAVLTAGWLQLQNEMWRFDILADSVPLYVPDGSELLGLRPMSYDCWLD